MRLTSLTCAALAFFASNAAAQSSAADNTTQPVSFFYTRPLSQAPALNITLQADFSPGYIFMSPYKSDKPAPYIYDKFGNLVWDGYGVTGSSNAHNFRPCQYMGAAHLCFNQVNQQNGYGIGQGVVVDQNYKVVATVQTGGNAEPVDMHEFQLLHDGETAIVSAYQIVPSDLSYFNITTGLGWLSEGVFQEVNVTTGEVLFEWFSTNHVDPSESQITPHSTDTGGDGFGPLTAFDYFHINAIDKSAATGNYLVSARHTGTLYYVNATDQDIIWKLSYLGNSDFSCSNFNFSFQHDARLLSENHTTTVLSIFDNASNGYTTTTSQSSGKVIAIDHHSVVATMISKPHTHRPRACWLLPKATHRFWATEALSTLGAINRISPNTLPMALLYSPLNSQPRTQHRTIVLFLPTGMLCQPPPFLTCTHMLLMLRLPLGYMCHGMDALLFLHGSSTVLILSEKSLQLSDRQTSKALRLYGSLINFISG